MESFAKFTRRIGAGVGAMALAAATFAAVSPAALAADDLAPGNIDPAAQGSLIIHKHESGSQTGVGTPDGKTEVGGTGIAGVTFTAYPLTNVKLTENSGWESLKNLTVPADACGADWKTPALAGFQLGEGKAAPATDANGSSTIADLAVGAYLVCETEAPATVAKKAAPFVVTVPFPNNAANAGASNDGTWLYNVNVYPKNTVVETPTKEINVKKNGIGTGEQVEFPVTTKIPSIGADEQFRYFIVSDPFDTMLSEGTAATVTVDGTAVDPSYYEVTAATDANDNTASVGFTRAGLTFLQENANKNLVVTFTAKVKALPADGKIPNVARLYVDTEKKPDTPPTTPPTPPTTPPDLPPNTPPVPTNKVISSWGDYRFRKVDADKSELFLAGAKFKIYNTTDEGAFKNDCSVADKTGDAISINGSTEFVSNAEGVVSFDGLFVDSKTGVIPDGTTDIDLTPDHTTRCYVIEEVEAPNGYTLPAGEKALTAVKITAGQSDTTTIADTVSNTKQDVPDLPFTGAQGKLLMTIGGSALLAFAFGYAALAYAKKKRA